MIRRLTPQRVGSYAKAFGVDTVLKTKPVKAHIPRADIMLEERVCSSQFIELFEYLKLPENYRKKNLLYIERLFSHEKGGGTTAIKNAVRQSIEMGNGGRVGLHAGTIDPDRGHPYLFYYKLGFRSSNRLMNVMAENMLKSSDGGPRPNMFMINNYFMYLPEENIEHCLNYRVPPLELTYAPKSKKPQHRVIIAVAEAYKKAFGADSILKTNRPDIKRIEPRIDVEKWIIEKFSPTFSRTKYPQEYIHNPVTYVELLDSYEEGAGTRAVKNIVRGSLKDKSEGRVALNACLMDFEKGNSIGFYYKLGFRSVSEKYNKICEEWLKKGGKMEDRPWQIKYWPFAPQQMYLPKENIEHCLQYPEKTLKLAK